MKLYTKSGDDGSTSLFGGKRVSKADLRVAAYGDVDELNAAIGVAVSTCNDDATSAAKNKKKNQCSIKSNHVCCIT
jgi:cob(I)alamin adenosyltransferase